MNAIDSFILISALLLLFGVASSKFSARLGLPVLVLFIGVGMFAGSEGIGGIDFDNFVLANGVGTVALALILFDGGLHTSMASVKRNWRPALSLATVGVLLTTAITGLAATLILRVSPLHGLLLGAMVGSTDAAAVFSVLRSQGLVVPDRVGGTLELESGSNDPMAIFLTIGLLSVMTGEQPLGIGLLGMFATQMGVGAIVGVAVGFASRELINRINLGSTGLYPVLTGSCGMFAFGLAAALDGSGFLAIYLAGIVLGDKRLAYYRGTSNFFDGTAWVAQIAMFVVLGLLSSPSRLWQVAPHGLAIAVVLVLIARPIAVGISLLPFWLPRKEVVFIVWGGLRGAVPIILATFALMANLDGAWLLFDIIFFVVLLSAITQGWTLPMLARYLGLLGPRPIPTPFRLEMMSLHHVNADIVEYTVTTGCRIAGRTLTEHPLPDGVVIALISRGNQVIAPRGSTVVAPDDRLYVVLDEAARESVDALFCA